MRRGRWGCRGTGGMAGADGRCSCRRRGSPARGVPGQDQQRAGCSVDRPNLETLVGCGRGSDTDAHKVENAQRHRLSYISLHKMSSPFMAHNCVDWSTRPPTRKTPLLVLSRGDVHVYTLVPHELKVSPRPHTTTPAHARDRHSKRSRQGNSTSATSTCISSRPAPTSATTNPRASPQTHGNTSARLSDVRPSRSLVRAKVTRDPRPKLSLNVQPTAPEIAHTRGKRKAPPDADDKEHGNERALGARLDREAVRDDQTMSDHGSDRPGASLLGDSDRQEEPWEEDVSVFPPPRARARRRLASEDEDEGDASEQDHTAPATSPTFPGSPVASPPKPTQQSAQSRHRPCHVPDIPPH